MHSYLRAIGFANITKESEVEKLLEDVYKKFDHREAVREDDTAFIEMEKEFAPDMGFTDSTIFLIIKGEVLRLQKKSAWNGV